MTLKHFRALSQDAHYKHLLVDGVCVADRETAQTQVLLFQEGDCYVEVIFTKEGDEVLGTHAFAGTDALDPYLEAIDLSDLV